MRAGWPGTSFGEAAQIRRHVLALSDTVGTVGLLSELSDCRTVGLSDCRNAVGMLSDSAVGLSDRGSVLLIRPHGFESLAATVNNIKTEAPMYASRRRTF